jgi:hypothetical protein
LFGIEPPKIKQLEEEKVEEKVEEEKIEEIDPLKVPPKVPITFRACKSLLLTDQGHQVVYKGLYGKAIALELLMRGSEHGFTKEEFQKRVYGVSPTLSVFSSHLGRVFGGYTTEAWASGN